MAIEARRLVLVHIDLQTREREREADRDDEQCSERASREDEALP